MTPAPTPKPTPDDATRNVVTLLPNGWTSVEAARKIPTPAGDLSVFEDGYAYFVQPVKRPSQFMDKYGHAPLSSDQYRELLAATESDGLAQLRRIVERHGLDPSSMEDVHLSDYWACNVMGRDEMIAQYSCRVRVRLGGVA